MPKKPCVRILMDSQYVKRAKRSYKSARQCFCHIFWSLWRGTTWKNSLLVVSEILRLFVNILKPVLQVFSLSKSECLTQTVQMQLSQYQKIFPQFFLLFHNLHKIFNTWKNRWTSEVISFWNCRLQKVDLLKSPKFHVSEHLWTVLFIYSLLFVDSLQLNIYTYKKKD